MSVKAAGYELSMQVISVHTNEQSEEEEKKQFKQIFIAPIYCVWGRQNMSKYEDQRTTCVCVWGGGSSSGCQAC